jgi:hypothetical protein
LLANLTRFVQKISVEQLWIGSEMLRPLSNFGSFRAKKSQKQRSGKKESMNRLTGLITTTCQHSCIVALVCVSLLPTLHAVSPPPDGAYSGANTAEGQNALLSLTTGGFNYRLKPVIFCYKKEIDPARMSQFGLVAEEVEKVNPGLVVRDKQGKPYSVRYDQVNTMLLNEFFKEHKIVQELKSRVQKQQAIISQQQQTFESRLAEQETRIEGLTLGF